MNGREQAPTHAAVLELRAERQVVREAYDFLDEKRLLLAAELLQQLARYEALLARMEDSTRAARAALGDAVKRHGLQGLAVYPAPSLQDAAVEITRRNLMGVTLADTALRVSDTATQDAVAPCNPSGEAQRCRAAFLDLLRLGAELAGVSGNLYRLFAEYRATERRASALENVILPDLESTLQHMSTYLEEMDLEDAVRARPRAAQQTRS